MLNDMPRILARIYPQGLDMVCCALCKSIPATIQHPFLSLLVAGDDIASGVNADGQQVHASNLLDKSAAQMTTNRPRPATAARPVSAARHAQPNAGTFNSNRSSTHYTQRPLQLLPIPLPGDNVNGAADLDQMLGLRQIRNNAGKHHRGQSKQHAGRPHRPHTTTQHAYQGTASAGSNGLAGNRQSHAGLDKMKRHKARTTDSQQHHRRMLQKALPQSLPRALRDGGMDEDYDDGGGGGGGEDHHLDDVSRWGPSHDATDQLDYHQHTANRHRKRKTASVNARQSSKKTRTHPDNWGKTDDSGEGHEGADVRRTPHHGSRPQLSTDEENDDENGGAGGTFDGCAGRWKLGRQSYRQHKHQHRQRAYEGGDRDMLGVGRQYDSNSTDTDRGELANPAAG